MIFIVFLVWTILEHVFHKHLVLFARLQILLIFVKLKCVIQLLQALVHLHLRRAEDVRQVGFVEQEDIV